MRVAVAAAPLDVADPDRDAGEFGGEFVDLQSKNVVRAGLHRQFGGLAEFEGFDVGLLFDVAQRFEREVEEVAAAAGRVEDAKVVQAQQEGLIGGRGLFRPGEHLGLGRYPFRQQRFGYHRPDQLFDGAGVGVMGAQRRAGGGVEAALEQGAEDGRVDGAPVHLGGGAVQGGQIGGQQRRHIDSLEQAAVEPGNVVVAVFAARCLHRQEQFFDAPPGLVGVHAGVAQQLREDAGRQQGFIFREHAEQTLHQEVGDALSIVLAEGLAAVWIALAAPAHGGRELGELAGGFGGDGGGGFFRTQLFRVGEHPA